MVKFREFPFLDSTVDATLSSLFGCVQFYPPDVTVAAPCPASITAAVAFTDHSLGAVPAVSSPVAATALAGVMQQQRQQQQQQQPSSPSPPHEYIRVITASDFVRDPVQPSSQQQQQQQRWQPFNSVAVPVSVSVSTAAAVSGLPRGWERSVTAGGRPYFINHIDHSTHWSPPC